MWGILQRHGEWFVIWNPHPGMSVQPFGGDWLIGDYYIRVTHEGTANVMPVGTDNSIHVSGMIDWRRRFSFV